MNQQLVYFFVIVVLFSTVSVPALSQEKLITPFKNTGFVDFNGYYDTREFSVLTINILAKLPHRFHYFSLTNYEGPNQSSDVSSFYAEHNIRWNFLEAQPVELTYQFVTRQGEKNDDHRLGLRWKVTSTTFCKEFCKRIGLFYSINPMFVQLRTNASWAYMTIIEHVYRWSILPQKLNNRLYIGGFADQNFIRSASGNVSTQWVTEHQLGIRLIDQLFAVLEYRINTFLKNEQRGLGYGLEYKIKF